MMEVLEYKIKSYSNLFDMRMFRIDKVQVAFDDY
jgi:hypothetical protein